jgi:hypothetical protein
MLGGGWRNGSEFLGHGKAYTVDTIEDKDDREYVVSLVHRVQRGRIDEADF